MAVNHDKKLLYVHIPKTGGTTIARAMGERVSLHRTWRMYKADVPDIWNNYHKFACVRNPYDRFISAYFYLLQLKGSEPRQKTPELVKKYNINELVKYLYLKGNYGPFQVFTPQWTWIYDEDSDRIMVDEVIRFENLHNDLKKILGSEIDIGHYKKTKRGLYTDYFKTNKEYQMLYEMYKLDFELFGYDLEQI